MLELLLGIVLFLVVIITAVPYFWRRHVSGVPGAFYLEQQFQALVIRLWRDYRASAGLSSRQLSDPGELARAAIVFAGIFRGAIEHGHDPEVEIYLRDFRRRRGERELTRTIIAAMLDYQCGDDPGLRQQALAEAFRRQVE